MFIRQVKYSKDNLGYLVYSASEGLAIDAGGVEDILFFAEKNGIRIKYVSNTHSHQDHTPGNPALLKRTDARFIDCRQIHSDQVLKLDQEVLNIIPTPGHTRGHVVFLYRNKFLFTGDHLAWSPNRQTLTAFRSVAWYSWPEQIRSMEKLLAYEFEWVLPGHGDMHHADQQTLHDELERCVSWMKTK